MNRPLYLKLILAFVWAVSLIAFTGISIFYLNDKFIIHNYRQAQTAITAQYFNMFGVKLNFQTPFMGYPWRVPMEFPIYQALVFLIQKCSGLNLIVCGKLLNILLHISNNYFILTIFKRLGFNRTPFFIGLTFYNVFPFYLVFDTVFLPDSLALFFVFLSFFFLISYFNNTSRLYNLLAFLCFAILTGLAKSTTFISVLAPLVMMLMVKDINFRKINTIYLFNTLIKSRKVLLTVGALIFSILISYVWIIYSDSIKLTNPFSAKWISSNPDFREWNYGTLLQRLSIENWIKYFSFSMVYHPLFIFINFVVFILFICYSNSNFKKLAIILITLFILPVLIFFNLFWVHTYYSIANLIFLMLLIGVMIYPLILSYSKWISFSGISLMFILLLFGVYRSWSFRNQIFKNGQEPGVYEKLASIDFRPNYEDLIFVIQPSRDPYLEYYFNCKGINISEDEFEKYLNHKTLKLFTGGAKTKMICIVNFKKLNNLPEDYKFILPYYSNHLVFSANDGSKLYFNFFWNN